MHVRLLYGLEEGMASKLKWEKVNRTDRARFEQAHPWPFTFPNSDRAAYTKGYDGIDWSNSADFPKEREDSDEGRSE